MNTMEKKILINIDHPINQEITKINDPRTKYIISFHSQNKEIISKAKGSSKNHQWWVGGYQDHVHETLIIARRLYKTMNDFRPLPFLLDSALIVLYFHDIEKITKYTTGLKFDKHQFYNEEIKKYQIWFTDEEINALTYIHGENEHYSNSKRTMNELAAFCHCVDTISARIWFNEGACKKWMQSSAMMFGLEGPKNH